MDYELVKVFGLQRSGNHAIINWIIGHNPERTLFFNNRRMGQPLLKSPSGVSVPVGVKAHATRHNGTIQINNHLVRDFREFGNRVVVSFENLNLSQFKDEIINEPIFEIFGRPVNQTNVVIIRNPFNLLVSLSELYGARSRRKDNVFSNHLSSVQKFTRRIKMDSGSSFPFIRKVRNMVAMKSHARHRLEDVISLWPAYARFASASQMLGAGHTIPIIYDRWVSEKGYRNELAGEMGFPNCDRYLNFVSDAGGGSSFLGAAVTGQDLKKSDLLDRWQLSKDREKLSALAKSVPGLVDEAAKIFGSKTLPDGL